jgi:hypothetical protein
MRSSLSVLCVRVCLDRQPRQLAFRYPKMKLDWATGSDVCAKFHLRNAVGDCMVYMRIHGNIRKQHVVVRDLTLAIGGQFISSLVSTAGRRPLHSVQLVI